MKSQNLSWLRRLRRRQLGTDDSSGEAPVKIVLYKRTGLGSGRRLRRRPGQEAPVKGQVGGQGMEFKLGSVPLTG